MIRDLFFSVPNADAAAKLVKLGEAEGWTAGKVYNYVKGEPFSEADDPLSVADPYIPEKTYSSVTLHVPDFDYDQIHSVHEKADELVQQVGGACTGGGCALDEGDEEPVVDVIPFIDDARPIVDYIVSQVGFEAGGMKDQAMEIRTLLVEAGWKPPAPVDADAHAALEAIVYRVNNPHYGDYSHHDVTAKAILQAGWTRPKAEED